MQERRRQRKTRLERSDGRVEKEAERKKDGRREMWGGERERERNDGYYELVKKIYLFYTFSSVKKVRMSTFTFDFRRSAFT